MKITDETLNKVIYILLTSTCIAICSLAFAALIRVAL